VSTWYFLPHCAGMVVRLSASVHPYYLTQKAERVKSHLQVILAMCRINYTMGRHAARNPVRMMRPDGINVARSAVGVLRATFNKSCPEIRNGKATDLER
jgi:UDP-N-acetyl-D-galactosamine dehydrogenase